MFPRDRLRTSPAPSPPAGWLPPHRTRSARWRLFLLVGALMSVLIAMNEARKPTTWRWLWGRPAAAPSAEPIDTRIDPQRLAQAPLAERSPVERSATQPDVPPASGAATEPAPAGEPGPASPQRPPATSRSAPPTDPGEAVHGTPPAGVPSSGVERQAERAWKQVWDTLSYDEKGELVRLLRWARHGEQPQPGGDAASASLAAKLRQSWEELLAADGRDVLLPAAELPADQQRLAMQLLAELETRWSESLAPAFEAAGKGEAWTDAQRAALRQLQPTIDAIALSKVRDDTVWRADERSAWFRLIEELQRTDPAELAEQSVGKVGFVQIFRQASSYRGKIVTVQGTARLAYQVPAPPNDLGVTEYSLFWIQPEDGSNRPIVVYALRPPPGFPPLTREQQTIHQPVTVTGYFFKRWVYRAADGLNSAPLILAAAPQWTPPDVPEPRADERFAESLGGWFWPLLVIAAASIAVLVLALARWIKGPGRLDPVLEELRQSPGAAAKKDWSALPGTPSLRDSLRQLEENPPDQR